VVTRWGYVVEHDGVAHDIAGVCTAIFDVLGPQAATVLVDAYTDYPTQMPDDIRAAELWLRDRGLRGSQGDPAAGIEIEPADEIGWSIARAYAPWSIHVALFDAAGNNLATIEDGGHAIVVTLTETEAEALSARIGPERRLEVLASGKR